jgi:hypothetical protein
MTYLLDVNLLVALFDSAHVNHEDAHSWFGRRPAWASCPLTENGFVRVLSNPSYPTVAATPNEILDRLGVLMAGPGHVFWPDDISIADVLEEPVRARFVGSRQVTDFYLVALARKHAGKLATFDGSISRALAGTALEDFIEIVGPA